MIRRIYGRSVRSYDFDEGVLDHQHVNSRVRACEGLGYTSADMPCANSHFQMKLRTSLRRVQMIISPMMILKMKRMRTQTQKRVRLKCRRK